jgi:tetrahydromethanopterin S-methyltransferase subunit B
METEDMDSVIAIASHSRLKLENQSDMVMEEGSQGISDAHQVSEMDVQMADVSENVQHEDTPVTDNMRELKPSSPAAGSLQVQDEISHHHDANGYMNASHTIEFVVEAITAEPPQNHQESIEEATETACLDNALDHKSIESSNRVSQQEPSIDRATGPEQEGQSSSVQEQGDSEMFAVKVIKDYGATDSVQPLEDDNRPYPPSIGNMRQTESYPSAPEKLLPNDTVSKSTETQYADLASNQSSHAFRYSPSIVILPESEQQEMVSASGPKVSTPESDHEDIAPASVLAPMSPELECRNIATATAPRILSPQSKHEDIAPKLIQTAMASDLEQEEIATAPALPASSPESALEDIAPNSASPVLSSELVHEEMAATVDLPSSSSEPEHEYEESKDSVMEHDEDTHENVSVDIDIFSSDDDVTTWKEQRDGKKNFLHLQSE